ncbi:hemocytin isoform X2 [Ischnura elegans]|uniref:hemocytin isoform X2 n=1 Tax=Ischnura elegans TaxID=197161 RepID=UPI001ED8B0DD|nr:hemocytin isoform X2 [Ischnura elegans]
MELTRACQITCWLLLSLASETLSYAPDFKLNGRRPASDLLKASEKYLGSFNWGTPLSSGKSHSSDDSEELPLSDYGHEAVMREFSGGSDVSFKKSGRYGGYGGSASGSSSSSSVSRGYVGGCANKPDTPVNAVLRCSMFSGCHASCQKSYQFPTGETQLYIVCKEGKWQIEGGAWETIPSCEPICLPACQNNGICIAPNQCNCPMNFRGPQCQFENKPCLNLPPLPMNSMRQCSPTSCSVKCAPNHQFPDGTTITSMTCKEGVWIPSRPEWLSVPDCEVVCHPPCQNGGICLSYNMCQCPEDFRGPQCQYDASSCNAQKLQFNGAYNCTGSGMSFSCSISCPVGIEFEFPPAAIYTCSYETGLFSPSPIPQCKLGAGRFTAYSTGHSSMSQLSGMSHSSHLMAGGGLQQQTIGGKGGWSRSTAYGTIPHSLTRHGVVIEQKKPSPGTCFTWGHSHYKTFDGKIFDFTSSCLYTLVRDAVDNTFSVSISNDEGCTQGRQCHRTVSVFVEEKEYLLSLDTEGDAMMALNGFQRIAIPSTTREFTIENVGNFVVLSIPSCGITVRWNTKDFVQVDVGESLWNKTSGLCGLFDGHANNDLVKKDGTIPQSLLEFVNSWEQNDLEARCNGAPSDLDACSKELSSVTEAEHFCQKLLTDPKFARCRKVLDVTPYYSACRWDYCACHKLDPAECACAAMSVYVQECSRLGVKEMPNWRDSTTCPMHCADGKVYSTCGPTMQLTCGSAVESAVSPLAKPVFCVEGCFCPEGTLAHNGKCIQPSECPCQLRGKLFAPGDTVPSDCNTCRCESGKWSCTQAKCGARCSSIGDPHYVTFDGRHYNFMGKCSYHLVKGDNFSIEAENVACAGSISEAMNFPVSISSGLPSCTKALKIQFGGHIIKLKQNREVIFNGEEITEVPYSHDGIRIRMVSSIFLMVELPIGLEVWWDGATRAYVDAAASLQGQTKGLCGTFNLNQRDDFLTPEGDVEQSVSSFANKWKTSETCEDVPDKFLESPCDVNIQKKALAERHCQKLKGSIFQACHWFVDPEQYYQDCMYDMCSCEGKVGECLCPILSAYVKECARQGMDLDWRKQVRECGIHCPGNQKYQVCGNSCTRSCFDISMREDGAPCKRRCVEGCNCPEGETLDSRGQCIPVSECPCLHKGLKFGAGHKIVMPGAREPELCTCTNALWDCHFATKRDLKEFPSAEELRASCRAANNEEFTHCEPMEPITCKNMHKKIPAFSPAKCKPGCQCKKGYVLDTYSKKCVRPASCPCHHGGKSYSELQVIQEDCNTCTCSSGRWNCTERVCAGICAAWGESHFKTFDGKIYDFHGACDYMFAKGKLNSHDAFDVTIQNVPCGSGGVTCFKYVTLKVGSKDKYESITFTKDSPLKSVSGLKRIAVREAGLFMFAEVFDLGLVLQWDKGTRLYLKLDPSWKNRVHGLCGNYNDNERDDFQTPSGGVSEVSPVVFGDSWKIQDYCPETIEVKDTCATHPNRKVWALQKCGVLKTEVFQPCHSEVALDPYFERCIFDTCGCDMGGDCECLCTSLAAYAHECSIRGVPIKWRTQHLCPMQCDESCSHYSPCIQTCPRKTCDNQVYSQKSSHLCNEDACVEGCEWKPCPEGEVYLSVEDLTCVPLKSCSNDCVINGTVRYSEGEVIKEDACHSCYCSRHEMLCSGKPCAPTTEPAETPTTTVSAQEDSMCVSGWSPWFSNDKPIGSKKPTDVEPISGIPRHKILKDQPFCDPHHMKAIECRTIGSHINFKETGQDVECSLERGLLCNPLVKGRKVKPCHDYEIRVHCACEPVVESSTQPVETTTTTPLTEVFHECVDGLGMESGAILDDQISVSSFSTPGTLGNHARLNGGGVWVAGKLLNAPNEWIQVDLVDQKKVTGLVLQGNPHQEEWVSQFQVGWSLDGHNWNAIHDDGKVVPKVFEGNSDSQTAKRVLFPHPVFAQFIKLVPVAFHQRIALRMDILGCDIKGSMVLTTTVSESQGFTMTPVDAVTVVSSRNLTERCDPAHPNFPHEADCLKFYQCEDTFEGIRMVPKTCGSHMMFHPEKLVCDWPHAVLEVRPQCGERSRVLACEDRWTNWFNISHPDSEPGDFETLSNIKRYSNNSLCRGAYVSDIECRFKQVRPSKLTKTAKKSSKKGAKTVFEYEMLDYKLANQHVTCDKDEGLICKNIDQDSGMCMDYAVRFFCSCAPPETPPPTTQTSPISTPKQSVCPPGQEWRDCHIRCDQLCLHFDHILSHQGLCSRKHDCIAGCVDELEASCPVGMLWRDRQTCLDPQHCTCISKRSGEPVKPGAIFWESKCEACQCINNEYVCDATSCHAKATPPTPSINASRAVAPDVYTVIPTTQRPPDPDSQMLECNEWTRWYSQNTPHSSNGDFESIHFVQQRNHFCQHPTSIECTTVDDETAFSDTGDEVTCSLESGLKCYNKNNGKRGCRDYKIRIFCSCETTTKSPIASTFADITPSSPGLTTTPVLCDGWSPWINDNENPKSLRGDHEYKSVEQLHSMGFCKEGEVAEIECRDSKAEVRFSETLDSDVICSISDGLICKNEAQVKGRHCKDYKIRYYCSCGVAPIETTVSIVHSTTSPPPDCHLSLKPLVNGAEPLGDDAFSASSSKNLKHGPHSARMTTADHESGLGWIARHQNQNQYLQVDLGKVEPVYGVQVQGTTGPPPMFVSSFFLLFSDDGLKFSYATDADGKPKLFRGPFDENSVAKVTFARPFEARYLRFNPATWKNGISLVVEIFGCGDEVTTTEIPTTPIVEVMCKDEMGLENGLMSDGQIEASSVRDNSDIFSPKNVRPNTPTDYGHGGAWIPSTNSLHEWIQFDFLEPRNLTGIITKGQNHGNSWVESYKVMHSSDRRDWNPVIERDGSIKIFPGNFDANTPHENLFDRPIQTRFLKIMPQSWHNAIALRAEVLGCFHPYPPVTTVITEVPTTPPPPGCEPCPNLPPEVLAECLSCPAGLFWDGSACVRKSECQCYVGHIPYAVGVVYKTEDCQQCTCTVGGNPRCVEQTCPKCDEGLRSMLTPQCGCVCKPCPPGFRICPTSDVCIEEYRWCDGVEDCSDDEKDCLVSTTTVCPEVLCPPGTTMETKSSTTTKTSWAKGRKGGGRGRSGYKKIINACPDNVCVPKVPATTEKVMICPPQKCPKGYELIQVSEGLVGVACPQFECKLVKVIDVPDQSESVCKVNGRNFETFDDLEYNYDVCHHILARDMLNGKWNVSAHRDCSECPVYLVIAQDHHLVKLNNNLTVEYGPHTYKANQVKKIGAKHKQFDMARVGDAIIFKSLYGFWVYWDGKAAIKVGASQSLVNKVDGLCGFYNHDGKDDRRAPDGQQVRTSKEFGDSWFIEGHEECENRVCGSEMQAKAWEICSLAKKKSFAKCKDVLNMNKFEAQCLEMVCKCLEERQNTAGLESGQKLNGEKECRCDTLLHFATECKAHDSTIDLGDWRIIHGCVAECPPGEVYKDCYERQCEPSCGTLMDKDPCPRLENSCFPGCFCPDGLVRKGSSCVSPVECRDCTCDCFGDPHYLTFDRVNYTFNGNCTYIAARDVNPQGEHDFQVLTENKECIDKPASSCAHAITILFKQHTIHLQRAEENREVQVSIDGNTLHSFPLDDEWVKVERFADKDVNVLIPSIQLEVSFYFDNFAFVIRLPSHLYANKTEGLCGNCNKNKMDDMKTSKGNITEDADEFGLSWLVDLPPGKEEKCGVAVVSECQPLPPQQDPCLHLLDEKKFGLCHPVVDPEPFLVSCRSDICHSTDKEKSVCQSLDAYARECAREGVCLDWKTDQLCPFDCPQGLEYHQCGTGCFETCDLHNKTGVCSMSSIDGCYCPSGKVWKDKKCVEAALCRACDEEGHFPGDVWYPNQCEECSCSGSSKVCKIQTCPEVETICESSMTAVKQPQAENECCPKYLCVAGTTPSTGCPQPHKPECGYGQELKMVTSISGCKEYICVCVPIGECQPLASPLEVTEEGEEGEPGVERWTDYSGCCPRVIERCNVTLCPPKPDCPKHHIAEKLPLIEGKCCPDYKCSPPKDVCVYEHEFTASEEGGERLLQDAEKFTSIKKVGEVWEDGPCRECVCVEVRGGRHWGSAKGRGTKGAPRTKVVKTSCSSTICPSPEEHPDAEDYQLERVPSPQKCCPDIVRKACLDEGKIYQVGKEWSVPGESCISKQCILSTNASLVIKQYKVQHCVKVCEKGWEYQEPGPDSEECCGKCKQVACVADGKMHPVGSSWLSSDYCTTYYCREIDGVVQTQSVDVSCPQDEKIREDFKVEVLPFEGSCCNKTFKIACLVGEHELKEGETFLVSKCKKILCAVGPDKELMKHELIETCNKDCAEGWEYSEPPEDSPKCCGECKQVACVTDDGELLPPGSRWETNGGCTEFLCEQNENQLHVVSSEEKCPNIDDCPPENVYQDKCCKKCNITNVCPPVDGCAAVEVEPPLTVAVINEQKIGHGNCINTVPIPGFQECKGHCQSSSYFDLNTLSQQAKCKCCQATSTKSITVQVVCEDGYAYERRVSTPTSCACNACESADVRGSLKKSVKMGVKTGGGRLPLKHADE